MIQKLKLIVLMFLVSLAAVGSQTLVTREDKTPVYSSPSSGSEPALYLKKDKVVKTDGLQRDGFLRLKTKSGRPLWIRETDVTPPREEDLETEESRPKDFRRLTLDAGASTGSVNGQSFFELNIGLNYYFLEWLSWRNAVFFRSVSNAEDFLGLDTSLRAHHSLDLLTVFAGPGYRFVTTGNHVPFVEGGAIIQAGGLSAGLAVKWLAHSLVRTSTPNEVIYTIIFAAHTRLL